MPAWGISESLSETQHTSRQPGNLELLPRVCVKPLCGPGYTKAGDSSSPNTYSLDSRGGSVSLGCPGRGGLVGDHHRPPALGVPQMLSNGKGPASSLRSRVCWVTLAACIFTKTQQSLNEQGPALQDEDTGSQGHVSTRLPQDKPQASVTSAAPHAHCRAEPYRSPAHPDPRLTWAHASCLTAILPYRSNSMGIF